MVFTVYDVDGERHSVQFESVKAERITGAHGRPTPSFRFYTWSYFEKKIPNLPEEDLLLYYTSTHEHPTQKGDARDKFDDQLLLLFYSFFHGAVLGWRVVQEHTPKWIDFDHEISIKRLLGDRSVAEASETMLPNKQLVRNLCKADMLAFYVRKYNEDGPQAYAKNSEFAKSDIRRMPYSPELQESIFHQIVREGFLGGTREALALKPDKFDRASTFTQESIRSFQGHLRTLGLREGWIERPDVSRGQSEKGDTSMLPRGQVKDALEKIERLLLLHNRAPISAIGPPRVFIIHGHDEAKRRELMSLLTDRFRLNAVVMQEKPGKSRTLIEKFEEEANQCNAAIAILTADDFVSNADTRYGQPRPNVIYELGWFAGKYGRSRTLMIVKNGTDIPSDLSGIEQIRFSEDISEKLLDLEQEIKAWSQPSKTATTDSPSSDSGKENQDQRKLREEFDALKLAIFGETDVQKIRDDMLKLEEEIKAAGRLR